MSSWNNRGILAYLAQCLLVRLWLEPDDELAAHGQNGPLDHGRLVEHQRDRLLLGEPVLVLLRQLAERRAGAVEQRLPADLARPALKPGALDPFRLVVVERVGDAMAVQPCARLLHRIAVLDAVDRDGLGLGHAAHSHSIVPGGLLVTS